MMPTDQPARRARGRTRHHLRANVGVIFWLLALLAVVLTHPLVPQSHWLLIHLLLLGAVTNAIVVWSAHFADTVLRAVPHPHAAGFATARLVGLNLGIALVVAGMVAQRWPLVLAGGTVAGLAVLWHGASLALTMRRALPSRFRMLVRYYVAAAALLPFGIAAGVLLADGRFTAIGTDRLVTAHLAINVLGWIGLTVAGTVVTLWPTILRTRVADGAEKAATTALPVLLGSVVAIVVAALLAPPMVALIGVAGYLAGLAIAAKPLIAVGQDKRPVTFASLSMLAGCAWLVVSLLWLAVLVATAPDYAALAGRLPALTGPLAAGFALQVLLGALTYLAPVVLGGGPVAVREATARLERAAVLRVLLVNGALAVWVMPVPSVVQVTTATVALVGLAAFLPLLALAIRDSFRARRSTAAAPDLTERRAAQTAADAALHRPGRFAGAMVTAIAVIALAVVGGVAIAPPTQATASSAENDASVGAAVTPTGQTTRVAVTAKDMRFHPSDIKVPLGNRLVITVTNTDDTVHDLVLATGAESGRLNPGQTATVDAGVVTGKIDGWCSIVGHRQLGMVMTITPIGTDGAAIPAAPRSQQTSSGGQQGSMPGMPGMTGSNGTDGAAGTNAPSAAADLNFNAPAPPGFKAQDAGLPPLLTGTVHHITLTARDVERDVAPGVKQTLWTFNGTMPGPTLHGKIGDTFVVHLVNDASMGHSIDFHAGVVAPDQVMRTIAPGQSLDYTFTATRSGVWMYHCSTMPMTAHIANGMFGAVIIDPPDLDKVDKQFVLIASELYLGPQGGPVDATKALADRPDAWVFNGYVNQYDYDPLTVKAGERIRIWVLDAGPNDPLAFHVVGGQFDTVFSEGAYLLKPGPPTYGGSQVLSLAPAQGGFVELTLTQPGHYPFVSHIMSHAEQGQHGIIHVLPR